ncbi:MAG: hypothetical protein D6740_12205 [Alphaproteobacteria bacterium]|nr:MAG: hypothetical protein D6740_12205 [Alphaproteobacteria bacterium]
MRLKTFTGADMKTVMAEVRRALGPDAIIVSVEQGKRVGGVRVTAAVEDGAYPIAPPAEPSIPDAVADESPPSAAAGSRPAGTRRRTAPDGRPAPAAHGFDPGELKAVIAHHGLPFDLAERVAEIALSRHSLGLVDALAKAFEALVRFQPLTLPASRPLFLVGPPGAGKTVTAAKLAAESLLFGHRVRLITTDSWKSGGIQQLETYARHMELPLAVADSPERLQRLAGDAIRATGAGRVDLVLIDSFGTNPFAMEELEQLVSYLKALPVDPLLVLPAGMDPAEAADVARIFAELGARRLIMTRLDGVRRLAAVLTAARSGQLALAGWSASPYLADAIVPPSPWRLAELFARIPQTLSTRPGRPGGKAAKTGQTTMKVSG